MPINHFKKRFWNAQQIYKIFRKYGKRSWNNKFIKRKAVKDER